MAKNTDLRSRIFAFAKRIALHLLVNVVAGSALLGGKARARVLRRAGFSVRSDRLRPGIEFISPEKGYTVEIGPGTFINRGCVFMGGGSIVVGRNCDVGPGVMFLAGSHEIGTNTKRAGASTDGVIEIGDGSWIGAGAIVLPGTIVASGSVIGAGSVVRGVVEEGVYAGVPARKVRSLQS